jgi:nucleoside transporter
MNGVRWKLSVMMFLEFFIWGAWLPLIFAYLPDRGFNASQQAWILNTFAIASFVGMFFSNQFADRNFSAERFLAVSHLIGGIAFLGLLWANNFWMFFALMMIHCLFYVPTISITNAIAFANLKDPQHDFGPVRLWGTIGWIAAAWPYLLFPDRTNMFYFTGIASVALAAFSLILPHTPPRPAKPGEGSFAWLTAIKYLATPFILVLFVVTFIDTSVHQCYFIWTETFLQKIGVAKNYTGIVMSIGQMAEIATMAVLGLVLKRLGWRTTMIIGILGHFVRFGLFAFAPLQWLAISINVVHGICYAFFFATVYIFVDKYLPKNMRTSAQGLFNVMILGLGPFVGTWAWVSLGDMVKTTDVAATVVYEDPKTKKEIKPMLELSGMVKNSLHGDTLKVTHTPPGDGDEKGTPEEVEIKIDGDGKLKHEFPPTAGKHEFSFEVERQRTFLGPKQESISLAVEAPKKKPETADKIPKGRASDFDFEKLFLYPAGTALLAAILLALFFHPPKDAPEEKDGAVALPH